MYISDSFFERSLFNIGAGFDWEPLARFSHLTDSFLYLNAFYEKHQVLRRLREDLKGHPTLELLDVREYDFPEGDWPEEVLPDFEGKWKRLVSMMGLIDGFHFNRCFGVWNEMEKWMLDARLRVRSTRREVRMIYLAAEGLTAYLSLSREGRLAPRILCTVQTGPLEHANGLTTSLLGGFECIPDIWVRGYEADWCNPKPRTIGSKDPLYPVKGCDFVNPWMVHASYLEGEEERRSARWCKAYLNASYHDFLLTRRFPHYGRNALVGGGLERLGRDRIGGRTLLIATSQTRPCVPKGLQAEVRTWEDSERIGVRCNGKIHTMEDSLNRLREIDRQGKYHRIYFLPFGYEHEGILLDAFLRERHRASMVAVVKFPLDLADLRIPVAPCGEGIPGSPYEKRQEQADMTYLT